MELRQLEMLLAVVETGTYAKAGEHLHISHSAIHRQIKLLEDELHDRVLVRKGRSVDLTVTGKALLETSRRIRQEVSLAKRRASETHGLQSGELKLGTGSSIITSFLAPVLQRYHAKYPGVEVHVVTSTADEIIGNLEKGSLDLGVVFNPWDMPRAGRRFRYEILYEEEFVWAVGRGHPLAKRKGLSLADLAQFPFIMLPKSSHIRRAFDRLFEAAGLAARVTMELENEEAIEKLVEINLGITLRSKYRFSNRKIHCLNTHSQPIYCKVGLVFPKGDYIPAAALEFARLCNGASAAR
ncbi:MAG: LysR family transcriptional regulator [Acidobacteriota bacterium]|nr:LysR family transcriptional regulator [Acidobacteriota bacterium]